MGEGQWLLPRMNYAERWNPSHKIDYQALKTVWLNRYQSVKQLVHNVDVVIEKSPPSMLRIEKIAALFQSYSFLALNREPYASCASQLYRYFDVDVLGPDKRREELNTLAEHWLMRSHILKEKIVKLDIPYISYEGFCADPASILEILMLPEGVVDTIDVKAELSVKDYQKQRISDQNQRQLSKLSDSEIDFLTELFKSERELLEYFRYELK